MKKILDVVCHIIMIILFSIAVAGISVLYIDCARQNSKTTTKISTAKTANI